MDKLPVILDTDIGTDVDDLFALCLLLASPEVNIVGVTVVHADVDLRARMVMKALRLAGRKDIPVAIGRSRPLRPGRPVVWAGHEAEGIDLGDVSTEDCHPLSAESFILKSLSEYAGKLNLLAIGPLTNLGSLYRDFPEAALATRTLCIMGGNYQGMQARSIMPEHNFKLDPDAAEHTLTSAVAIKLVGLNITKQTELNNNILSQIREIQTPLARLLYQQGSAYLEAMQRDSTPMHDSTAVAALLCPKIFQWQTVVPRVQTEGKEAGVLTVTKPSSEQQSIEIAVGIDKEAFQQFFFQRIIDAARQTSL